MTRALTAPELVKLRTKGHTSRLYLAILRPETVFSARVNQAFTASDSHDMIAQVTYDGATGDYTDLEGGETVYIGTAAGLYDVGMARVRKAATSSVLYVGEGSEVDWDNDQYLTVVKEWGIWPRHLKITGTAATVYMDYDIAYSDQNTDKNPIANLGADAVAWLTGASVDVAFDASDSFCLDSTIASYLWTCSDAASIADDNTATPTFTFDTAKPNGATVKCVVTATNGKTTTSYRNVWVFDTSNPPVTNFEITQCGADWQQGGWNFTVRMWDEALRTEIRDRAKVVLFARDWINSTEGSVGTESGRENILAVGWIAGETIHNDPVEGGWVEFRVEGPQYWLGRINGFPAGVRDTTATAAKWTEFDNLTVDKGLYHFLYWRTTLNACCDWYKSANTWRATAIEAPNGNLWGQITEMCERTILAHPACDRFGRLFTQVPVELLPPADRTAAPSVMTILEPDYERPIEFERRTTREVAQVATSGVYATPTAAKTFYSLSPGHVFARYGSTTVYDKLLLPSTQARANLQAGLISGSLNATYPSIAITWSGTNRAFDIAPIQRAYITIPADNERGITYDGYILPRRIEYSYDVKAAHLKVTVDFFEQTNPDVASNGDPPAKIIFEPIEPLPPIPVPPPPPPPPPPDPEKPAYVFLREEYTGIWMYSQYTDAWTNITQGLDDGEKVNMGADDTFCDFGCQLFGNGGGLYAHAADAFYAGDVNNGLYKLYDYFWLQEQLPADPIAKWQKLAANPFTGQVVALGRGNSGTFSAFNGFYNGLANRYAMTVTPIIVNNMSFSSSGKITASSDLAGQNFISADLGQTWTGYAHSATPQFCRGGGYTRNLVQWGSSGYVWTSDDDGQTQTQKGALPVSTNANNHQYAATTDLGIIKAAGGANIYTSTDGGVNFTSAAAPDTSGIILNFGATHWITCPSGAVGVGNTDFVYVTSDGTTWVDLTGDLYTQISAARVAIGVGAVPYIRQMEIIIKPFSLIG